MEIVFLPGTKADLRWFRRYYTETFSEGRDNATFQYRNCLSLLRENPRIGRPALDEETAREYPIPRTPFTILYRVMDDRIEILRLYDQRSDFSNRHLKPSPRRET